MHEHAYAITAYAFGVMIGSPAITLLAAGVNRRTLLLGLVALSVRDAAATSEDRCHHGVRTGTAATTAPCKRTTGWVHASGVIC